MRKYSKNEFDFYQYLLLGDLVGAADDGRLFVCACVRERESLVKLS